LTPTLLGVQLTATEVTAAVPLPGVVNEALAVTVAEVAALVDQSSR